MTESRCAQIRELAPEVALGIAPVRERMQVLEHVARCPDCRTHLTELSGVADDLLLLAPSAEPPSGFESAVLAQLHPPAASPHRRRGIPRRVLEYAVIAAVIATLAGGGVWWAGQADRELADQTRQALTTAGGEYLAAFPMRDAGGEQRGAVFAYEGEPAWLLCSLDEPLPEGWYQVELVTRDGATHELATGRYLGGIRAWGTESPVAIHDAALLRVVDKTGRVVLSARLTRS